MNSIKEYSVVSDYDSTRLIRKVNKMIQEGWQPFESPITISGEFIQAMVKYHTVSIKEYVRSEDYNYGDPT